jgi:uncharacterized protein YigE (DUF2233 family)
MRGASLGLVLVPLLAHARGCESTAAAPAGSAATEGVRTERITFAGASYDVVTVDLDRARVRALNHDDAGKPIASFARLREVVGPSLAVATNAGIFEPGLVPTGLFVADGREVTPINTTTGEGNFYLQPNGVFAIDDAGAWISPTAAFRAGGRAPRQATQSGPMLVSGGVIHASFRSDSTNTVIRNGVGVVSPRRIVLAISSEAVNLKTFATLFLERLGCDDALYLDGAISGMYAPSLGRQDLDRGPYAGFVVVEASARLTR